MPHPAALDDDLLLRDCSVIRGRASGPGGQHRNKVETAVTLTHRPTGVTGYAAERRSQAQNHAMALFRLRVNLALEVRCEPPGGILLPSALWQARTNNGRLAINPSHRDFPILLAEALDALALRHHDPAIVAAALAVTTSQLVKLLSHDRRALAMVNTARAQHGQHPLR
jgi:hypothetical protein